MTSVTLAPALPLQPQAPKNYYEGSEKLGLEVGLIRGEDMDRDIQETLRGKRLMDQEWQLSSVRCGSLLRRILNCEIGALILTLPDYF